MRFLLIWNKFIYILQCSIWVILFSSLISFVLSTFTFTCFWSFIQIYSLFVPEFLPINDQISRTIFITKFSALTFAILSVPFGIQIFHRFRYQFTLINLIYYLKCIVWLLFFITVTTAITTVFSFLFCWVSFQIMGFFMPGFYELIQQRSIIKLITLAVGLTVAIICFFIGIDRIAKS